MTPYDRQKLREYRQRHLRMMSARSLKEYARLLNLVLFAHNKDLSEYLTKHFKRLEELKAETSKLVSEARRRGGVSGAEGSENVGK